MSDNALDPELEVRIQEAEMPENQGAGFSRTDWFLLMVTGVALPVALLLWGWN